MERAGVPWLGETALTRPLGDVERLRCLIDAAERAGAAVDHDLHVDLLWPVASRAWLVDLGSEARQVCNRQMWSAWARTRTSSSQSSLGLLELD